MKYYLIAVDGGTEPQALGPFKTGKLRDAAAKAEREYQKAEDSLFKADVDSRGKLRVWPFVGGFFEEPKEE